MHRWHPWIRNELGAPRKRLQVHPGGSGESQATSTPVSVAVATAIVVAPILLIWGCFASIQNSVVEDERREAAAQARIRNQDREILKQLVVSNPRMGSDGLAQVIFGVTNNSNSRVCNLYASITYTPASGARQGTSQRLLRGGSCLGYGGPYELTVTLPNRKLRGAMICSTPKVILSMPPGGISGDWDY